LLIASTDPKRAKTPIHFDLCPTDRDQAAEVERLVALGASRVDIGQRDVRWVVLADPAGNEFCVMPKVIPPEPQPFHHLLDEDVHADAAQRLDAAIEAASHRAPFDVHPATPPRSSC
jgi:hypothetical protein